MNEKPLNAAEAALFLGVSKGHLYNLMSQKKIPYYKPEGKLAYFRLADLEGFVFRNRCSAAYELENAAEDILNHRF
jgi:excisionase family DNA binding protein